MSLPTFFFSFPEEFRSRGPSDVAQRQETFCLGSAQGQSRMATQGQGTGYQHPSGAFIPQLSCFWHNGKAHQVTCVDQRSVPLQTQVCLQVSPILTAPPDIRSVPEAPMCSCSLPPGLYPSPQQHPLSSLDHFPSLQDHVPPPPPPTCGCILHLWTIPSHLLSIPHHLWTTALTSRPSTHSNP